MIRSTLLLISMLFVAVTSFAQLPNGSQAPDWTFTDIDGNTHTLSDYLNDGKTVILDFFATWCPPCWTYHNSGALEHLYEMYGPDGTDEVMVFYIEASSTTNLDDIHGVGSSTQGDWYTGTPFPIIHTIQLNNPYQINGFPTVYGICPNGEITELGTAPTSVVYNFVQNCPVPEVLIQGVSSIDVDCFGANNGQITIQATGTPEPLTYNWSNGMTSSLISGLAPGTYTCTVTNASGQEVVTDPITINGPDEPITVDIESITTPDCYGNMGSVETAVSGGGGNYSYTWSNGSTAPIATDLPSGFYSVSVEDALGCIQVVDNIEVAEPNMPMAAIENAQTLNCFNTSIDLDASASTSSSELSYVWTTVDGTIESGVNDVVATVSAPGSYDFTVLNVNNGCSDMETIMVLQDITTPSIDIATPDILNCENTSVVLEVNTGDHSIEWMDGNGDVIATNATIEVNTSGDYNVVVTNDDNGCTSSEPVTVIQDMTMPMASIESDNTIIDCHNNMANLMANIEMEEEVSLLWQTADGNIDGDVTIAGVTAVTGGEYTLVVTHNISQCTTEENITIEELPIPTFEVTQTNILCFGESAGEASVQIQNGVEPYAYTWSTGDNIAAVNNLTAGTYLVTATDANGCNFEASIDIEQPEILEVDAAIEGESAASSADGSISINTQGGVAPYTIEWNTGQTTFELTDLTPGDYSYTVYDANGCTVNQVVTVPSFECAITGTIAATAISCFGETDGSVMVQIEGGNEPYNIEWSNGSTGSMIEGVVEGSYSVEITDASNCPLTLSADVVAPAALEANVTTTNESSFEANNGMATANTIGGTTPYSYNWSNGASTQTITNLAPGQYTVSVTDANGCMNEQMITIEEYVCNLMVEAIVSDVTCANLSDGVVELSITGGTGEYTYQWNDGSTQATLENVNYAEGEVTVMDEHNCQVTIPFSIETPEAISLTVLNVTGVDCADNAIGTAMVEANGGTGELMTTWSNGLTGNSVENLIAGMYEVVVTDANGCIESTMVNVEASDEELPVLMAHPMVTLTLNDEGNATLSTDMVDNGSTDNCGQIVGALNKTNFSCEDIGEQQVIYTVSDGAGNSVDEMVTIVIEDTTVPTANTQNITVALDGDGMATITAEDVDNNSFDNCSIAEMSLDVTTFDCSNIGGNMVTLTVMDANGLSAQATANVTIVDEIAPTLTCGDDITTTHCTPMVTYDTPTVLDNCIPTGMPTLVEGLASGEEFPIGETVVTYNYTDNGGQIGSCSFSVVVPQAPVVSTEMSNVSCAGGDDGAIDITIDGDGTYTYFWSNGASTAALTNLSAGSYSVSITGDDGCELQQEFTIEEPTPIVITVDNIENEINQGQNASIDVTVSGGIAPYSFVWTDANGNQLNTEDLSNISAGEYTLEVTDANDCMLTSEIVMVDNLTGSNDPALEASIVMSPNPTQDIVTIDFAETLQEDAVVKVFGGLGQLMQTPAYISAGTQKVEIDLSNYTAATYRLQVIVGDKAITKNIQLVD